MVTLRYNYTYFISSPSMISPPFKSLKNEYRGTLLQLRGGECIHEILIDAVDGLMNESRIADEYIIHEQELTTSFLDILADPKYKTFKNNKDQLLVRYALQYYTCYTVQNLKNKLDNKGTVLYRIS